MSEQINIEQIYRQERQRWLREEAPRKSMRDRISDSVPYWIIVVALVLYGLSAPHTASVFDKLTSGWGWIVPIGVEFGLLYTAFRRRYSKATNEAVSWTLWLLEALLFLTAMLVNGAGSFTSVINSVSLEKLSFAAIAEQFGNLPATSQAALIMAVLSAFIIPIGALVAGEGLAILVLERRDGVEPYELRWQEVEFTVTYRALFVRYLQTGLPDKDAKLKAFSDVKGYLSSVSRPAVRALSAGSAQTVHGAHRKSAQAHNMKNQVKAYLAANPDCAQLSISTLMGELSAQGIEVGRTTVAEVLREVRKTA